MSKKQIDHAKNYNNTIEDIAFNLVSVDYDDMSKIHFKNDGMIMTSYFYENSDQ